MAAMSSVSGTTTLTPPSSSHDNQAGWKPYATSGYQDNPMEDRDFTDDYETTNGTARGPLSSQNGNANYDPFARRDATEPFPATKELQSRGRTTSPPENKRSHTGSPVIEQSEENKWIHRDKLARIESEELQAAGIILPKPRALSRPRRERSTDKMNGQRRAMDDSDQQPLPRSRKNSTHTSTSAGGRTPEVEVPSWDFRLPTEIAEDPGEFWVKSGAVGPKGSRIPVAKVSPAPIPTDYLERDAPVPRKMSGTLFPDEDFSLSVSKSRSRSGSIPALNDAPKLQPTKRSATEGSPKKAAANGTRKPSGAVPKTGAAAAGRPKTRGGPGKEPGSTARPTTRSGDLTPANRAPEGEPPWMISAYKPDPRLPPDQQLLPTVARRLQQEKWEKDGTYGNIYDKEFRPLTDEGFLKPPELQKPQTPDVGERQDEWPLRVDSKSPTPSRPGTSSYSTMPKIQDKPVGSPLPSPRLPPPQQQLQPTQITRVPSAQEDPAQVSEKPKKSGCGCCVVM